jgi:peptide/nickel transport system substrate-binding protein
MPGHTYNLPAAPTMDEARGLLADAGYPEGAGLGPFKVLGALGVAQQAEALVEQLGRLGLAAEIIWSGPEVCVTGNDCDIWVCTWFADFPDPEGFYRGLIGDPDDPWLGDPDAMALLDQARASRDRDERLRLYAALDRRLVVDEARMAPIAYSRATILRRPWVRGVWANALTPLRLDRAMVQRTRHPAGTGAGVASSV